ncbi:hypothetical protein MICAH_1940006 [Microcystis aeruginosa PCC 9809]|uniref:Uncharacterized protein n=1 Tax=Microcystis aeruginosa PCC 9809 TaxID=1160285 RepID=I4HKW9_MICAE|nr:hypothetical protein MICAH_1940006 [Microcystis aeruginosa PCC 9809]
MGVNHTINNGFGMTSNLRKDARLKLTQLYPSILTGQTPGDEGLF